MKRLGFLGAMGGALAAAALPIPTLPTPKLTAQLPALLAYSEEITKECMAWGALNEVYCRTPYTLLLHPDLVETAKEALYGPVAALA